MSIKYNVVPNALRPGEFYPRPVSITTRTLEQIILAISRSTTVSSSDVKAVIDAFIAEIVAGLLNGDRVSLDNFVDFRPRLSQVLDSAATTFDPQSGGQLLIAATVKPELTSQVRQQASFEKLTRVIKRPSLESFQDARTRTEGVYSPGGSARIIGNHLQIFDEPAPEEGIFFIAENGTETKVAYVQDNGTKKLTFEIPAGLSGIQRVQVRTQYTPGGRLRVGELDDPLLPAEA